MRIGNAVEHQQQAGRFCCIESLQQVRLLPGLRSGRGLVHLRGQLRRNALVPARGHGIQRALVQALDPHALIGGQRQQRLYTPVLAALEHAQTTDGAGTLSQQPIHRVNAVGYPGHGRQLEEAGRRRLPPRRRAFFFGAAPSVS